MRFKDGDGLSAKGEKALRFTLGIIKQGLFPGSLGGEDIKNLKLQVRGMDIVIPAGEMPERIVQVKCDYAGGRNGLYLQIAECNPFSRH